MSDRIRTRAAVIGALLLLSSACGGGGSGGVGSTSTGSGTISGMVMDGPVQGASIAAFAIGNGTLGAQLGSATTDSAGTFTVSIGGYTGPVMLQATGGSYTDDATGTTMTMQPGDVMTSAVPTLAENATTTGIEITPLTSMAQARAHALSGGMTDANIAAANGAVGSYFSVSDILHVVPMDPTKAGSGGGATQDGKDYGMAIAAMSQYAKTIGMPSSSGMITAMKNDASDGVMDGKVGGSTVGMGGGMMSGVTMQPNAGTVGLADSMTAFIGSPMNHSGVGIAEMQALVAQLTSTSGQLAGGSSAAAGTTISGTAFMGGMRSGTVTAYALTGGTMGGQLGSSAADAFGHFSVSLGSYAGPVLLQLAGGTYVDEATGTTMTMLPGDVLTSCVPTVAAGSTTSGIEITPLTGMAQARAQGMTGGMTAANITAANAAIGSYFMVDDILTTTPMDPATSGAGAGADQSGRDYGMSIAAMSQYARTVGMTTSSGMVTAMMRDAADGVMNGMMGATGISMSGMGGMMMGGAMMQATAGTTGLASAMTSFIGSQLNRSGLQISDMQPLVNKLSTSNGTIS